ncbi:MAG TPA: PP2C family serine/threonine-protein phosphatase [Bryobacteraceae bacterium]|nr:PP2C family serine/threonine-protein phosphatase [Bryobacteraceae bacterium]
MQCPKCVALIPDEDLFCESCGSRVQAEPEPEPMAECPCFNGVQELDEEGFCLQCGRRVVRPAEDHIEVELSPDFAGVSDRGLHHHSNEDRFAIGVHEDWRLLVVCDGVSSSPEADKAAAQASQSALVAMQTDLANDSGALDAVKNSVKAASEAVAALGLRRGEAPSTTIVSAAVSAQQIAIAWIGDSRAYWIASDKAHQLTADHSWLNMILERGEVDRAEAQRSRNAHALTRWLGLDSDPGEPDTFAGDIEREGILLLCSDGLWNYADTDQDMSDLVRESSQSADTSLEIARHLVDYAITQGGRDNITAVLMRRAEAFEPEVPNEQ